MVFFRFVAAPICSADGLWPVAPTFSCFLCLYLGLTWFGQPGVDCLVFKLQSWDNH